MGKALSHRDHDARHQWTDGAMGGGFTLRQPRCKPFSDGRDSERNIYFYCDANLNNSDELCNALSLDPKRTPDNTIILESYLAWGADCTRQLSGAFAFAIYNGFSSHLFCARDHFGIKPFYYCLNKGLFAFGSEARAMVDTAIVERRYDDLLIADVQLRNFFDKERCFYKDISRLPPGHSLIVSQDHVEKKRYWSPSSIQQRTSISDVEAAREFRRLFELAVSACTTDSLKVGAFLSGGLDSSSVTAVAARQLSHTGSDPFPVFSAVFPGVPASDESRWISAFLEASENSRSRFERNAFEADKDGPANHFSTLAYVLDEPNIVPNLYQTWKLALMASEAGVDVMLTGHDGDTVVSHGFGILTELALEEDWSAVEEHLSKLSGALAGYSDERLGLLKGYVLPAIGIMARRGRFLAVLRSIGYLNQKHKISRRHIVKEEIVPNWLTSLVRAFKNRPSGFAGPYDCSHRVHYFRRRISGNRRRAPSEFATHANGLESGLIAHSFEAFDKIGARLGVDFRHPFFDKRLVEFCISLPPHQKVGDGLTRHVLRNAMAGILPEAIRTRNDKSNLAHSFVQSFTKSRREFEALLQVTPKYSSDPWDIREIDLALERYSQNPSLSDAMTLFHFASHRAWTKTHDR